VTVQDEVISKTKQKQAMLELQVLGAALVELPESQLAALSLRADLHAAVLECKRIRSHEARRRQMQFIGRLMREVDAAPIRAALESLDNGSAQAAAYHRRLEAWRERLLADDGALTAFAAEHPGADLQVLRTLIRNSRRELKEGRSPRAYRELFRLIRTCSGSSPS
jgi:ribosome-associated protein